MKVLVSTTGVINGRGSARFKWVSYLTKEERDHVKNGGTVLIEDVGASHHTQCGWKQVIYYRGKYSHREATKEQIKSI